MPSTGLELIREIGSRTGDLILSTPTSVGTTTTIVDAQLQGNLSPVALGTGNTYFLPHVYCYSAAAGSSNRGLQRRGSNWAPSSNTLTLLDPGFPTATAVGEQYEINLRYPRSRIISAINSALGELNLLCAREYIDESISTEQGVWEYDLPPTTVWSRIKRVEFQINPDTQYETYPYSSADVFNWTARHSINSQGQLRWKLQFGMQPIPDRILRIYGDAIFPKIVTDQDIVALAGDHEVTANEWIYDYAMCQLQLWMELQQPAGQIERYRRTRQDLTEAKAGLVQLLQSKGEGVVVTPGRGTGTYSPWPANGNVNYLGAFSILAAIGN